MLRVEPVTLPIAAGLSTSLDTEGDLVKQLAWEGAQ